MDSIGFLNLSCGAECLNQMVLKRNSKLGTLEYFRIPLPNGRWLLVAG